MARIIPLGFLKNAQARRKEIIIQSAAYYHNYINVMWKELTPKRIDTTLSQTINIDLNQCTDKEIVLGYDCKVSYTHMNIKHTTTTIPVAQ